MARACGKFLEFLAVRTKSSLIHSCKQCSENHAWALAAVEEAHRPYIKEHFPPSSMEYTVMPNYSDPRDAFKTTPCLSSPEP